MSQSEIEIQTWSNGSLGKASLDGSSLGEIVKMQLLRDAVRMYEANQRQGTVKTKTRAETAYTTRKPFKQKGTGNARRGDFNSPLLRGGGVIFGPRPRDYSFKMPRKALREALRSALLGKLRDGEIHGLNGADFTEPSTKLAAAALTGLGCDGSAAIVLPAENEHLVLSFRNLPRVHVIPASDLNTHHVLWHRRVILVDGAWDVLMSRLAGTAGAGAEIAATETEAVEA